MQMSCPTFSWQIIYSDPRRVMTYPLSFTSPRREAFWFKASLIRGRSVMT